MKRYWLLSGICLAGCMASNALQYDTVAENNLYHIARTRKGMSEKEVLSIMHKPYSYESFVAQDDIYDVWFYVTQTTGLDQTRMVPQNLTPLTFKNGILVGTGYSWYYYAMQEQVAYCNSINPPAPKPPSQDELDREFETQIRPPIKESKPEAISDTQKALTSNTALVGAITQKFSQVHTGMTDTEVTNLVGNPSRTETYRIDGDIYDVWFYDSATGFGGNKPLPLTFKNSVLAGKTDEYYQKIKTRANQNGPRGYDKAADKMQSQESEQNFDFW